MHIFQFLFLWLIRYHLWWGWSSACSCWTTGELHHAGWRPWICALSPCKLFDLISYWNWLNEIITALNLFAYYLLTCVLLLFLAPFGEFGYSWRDSCARQGSGVPAEDLPWTLSSGLGSALWASGEAFGQRRLVHVTYLCLWTLQCLLPTSVQYSQSWDPPVSLIYLWGVFCYNTAFSFWKLWYI